MAQQSTISRCSALTDIHLDLGAVMMTWNGMSVPSFYGTDVSVEYLAIRERAGLTDMSGIRKIWVSGPDAEAYLDYTITRNCKSIPKGRAAYTALLNNSGCLIDDAIVFHLDEKESQIFNAEWLISTGAGTGLEMLMHNSRDKGVHLQVDEDLHCLLIQGPNAANAISSLFGSDHQSGYEKFQHGAAEFTGSSVLVSRTSYSGEDGFEIFASSNVSCSLWNMLLQDENNHIVPVGFNALDIARIEAGLLFFGRDMTGKETPAELDLDFIVDLTKPFFRGRDAYLSKRNTPRILTMGIELDSGGGFSVGDRLCIGDEEAGSVQSAAYSPLLKNTIGIAHISSQYALSGKILTVMSAESATQPKAKVRITSRRFIKPKTLSL